MILTVTPNTALDRVLFVEDFALGRTSRATGTAEGMGGKGAVTSWVLGQLGVPSIATGLAAGETGRRMVAMLEAAGVRTDFVWVGGETRTNYVIARERDGAQGTVTVAGLQATPEDGELLRRHVLELLGQADALLCGGSLPQGLPEDWYVPLIRRARELGVTTLLDASGPYLAANLAGGPDIVKPNADEAEALVGRPISDVAGAADAARELRRRGVGAVAITLGAEGAVAATDEGVFHLPPVPVRAVNTAGAGDGFNGGLLVARLEGAPWAEALRRAAAIATAVVLTPGTGACRYEDVAELLPRVRVVAL